MGKREQLLEIMEDAAKGETKATLRARIAALEAENARLRAELDEATVYARNLLTAFVGEHFPDNDRWKPLDDLIGMLTQFDNASTIARDYKLRLSALEATPPAPKVTVDLADLEQWRAEWLEANDPRDGTDCVTPYDKYLYSEPPAPKVTDEVIKAQNYLNDAVYSGLSDQEIARRARLILTAAQEAGKP